MVRRSGHPSRLITALAFVCSGCLPDPPAYDACTGDESNYYAVPPKGCNGHVLTTLQESQVSDPRSSLAMTVNNGGFYVRSTIELDEQYVYWVAPGNVVMRTEKAGEAWAVLFASAGSSAGILGIDQNRRRLYVGEHSFVLPDGIRSRSRVLQLDLDAPAIGSEAHLASLDVLPSYASVVADLSDIAFTRAVVSEDRLFLLQGSSNQGLGNTLAGRARILTADIVAERVVRASDLQVLVDDSVRDFTLSDSRLLYVLTVAGLVSLDLESGATEPLLGPEASSARPYASNGVLLVFSCNGAECTCSRLEADGSATPLAQGLNSYHDADIPVVADARGTYVMTDDRHSSSRLLDYSRSSIAPRLMVASLQPVYTLLAMDERYLYIRTEDISYAEVATFTTRLLRVTR